MDDTQPIAYIVFAIIIGVMFLVGGMAGAKTLKKEKEESQNLQMEQESAKIKEAYESAAREFKELNKNHDKRQKYFEMVSNMRHPLGKRTVRKYTRLRLEEIRESGIKFVKILGCNNPAEECSAYHAIKGKTIPIENAPELPLPDCNLQHCKCILLASKGPENAE